MHLSKVSISTVKLKYVFRHQIKLKSEEYVYYSDVIF